MRGNESKKKIINLTYQDVSDSDNLIQLGSSIQLQLLKRKKTLNDIDYLHVVLTARPALIGIPAYNGFADTEIYKELGGRELLKDIWLESFYSKEKEKFDATLFIKSIVKAEDNQWENGTCKSWLIKGSHNTSKTYEECIEEDSELMFRSNALRLLLFFKEMFQHNTLDETCNIVKIYYGGVASIKGSFEDPNRPLIAPLSHRSHVIDYNFYDENGQVSDSKYYLEHYLKSLVETPPQGDNVFVNMPASSSSINANDIVVYDPRNDMALLDRRNKERKRIEEKINKFAGNLPIFSSGPLFKPALTYSLGALHTYLLHKIQYEKEDVAFDILALAPTTGLARTLSNEDITKRVRKIVGQLATYNPKANIFPDQFNIYGDANAALRCFQVVEKYSIPTYILPTQIAKVDSISTVISSQIDSTFANKHPECVSTDKKSVNVAVSHQSLIREFESFLLGKETSLYGDGLSENNIYRKLYEIWNFAKSGGSRREAQYDMYANWLLLDNSTEYFNIDEVILQQPISGCAWILNNKNALTSFVECGTTETKEDGKNDMEIYMAEKSLENLDKRLAIQIDRENPCNIKAYVASELRPFKLLDTGSSKIHEELVKILRADSLLASQN